MKKLWRIYSVHIGHMCNMSQYLYFLHFQVGFSPGNGEHVSNKHGHILHTYAAEMKKKMYRGL